MTDNPPTHNPPAQDALTQDALTHTELLAPRWGQRAHRVPRAAYELLDRAQASLREGCRTDDVLSRYEWAQTAAQQSAAAVLVGGLAEVGLADSETGRPRRLDTGPTHTVWQALSRCAPSLQEWADFFTQVGDAAVVGAQVFTPRLADDVLRQSAQFVHLVHVFLHVPSQPGLPEHLTPARALRSVAGGHQGVIRQGAAGTEIGTTTGRSTVTEHSRHRGAS